MFITWKMLLVGFLALCGGFSTICVAGGWVIKIIKGLKKPSKNIHEMLSNDNERLKSLESQYKFILKAISLLLQDDLVILNHLRTDNNTGEMGKQEQKVQEFLIEKQSS